jgi:hypothetical protein
MEIQHQLSGQKEFTLEDAVIDVETFLQKARLLDFDDPLKLWMALGSFQSNFVGTDARIPRDEWAVGIENIRLLVEGLLAQYQGAPIDPIEMLGRARALERLVRKEPIESDDFESKPKHVKRIQELFRVFCESKKIAPRIVRGRSPVRALWYLVTIDNIQELEALLREE